MQQMKINIPMKKLLLLIICSVLMIPTYISAQTVNQSAEQKGRKVVSMNFGWKFHAGDLENAQLPGLDDAGWTLIDVPHDFQISQPWVAPDAGESGNNNVAFANIRSRLSARGFKEMGIGWYRKSFTPDLADKGKRVILDFEGILYVADVFLNGKLIGGTDYGYLGFEIDVTNELKWGEPNVIAVKADTREPLNSRWYTGAGLYRDVNMILKDAQLGIARHGIYITTPEITGNSATIAIQTEIENLSRQKMDLLVDVKIVDPKGQVVKSVQSKLPIGNYRTREYPLENIKIDNPLLWSCESPQLYTAQVSILRPDGSVADQCSEHFGIRTIEYSPAFGFKLNGKKVILKGNANHHEMGALGAAAYERAIEKRLQLMKSFGLNHIRTSHNPYSKSFLDLADKYGILVVDELFDKWNSNNTGGRVSWMELWPNAVPEFIKRDRNHPCVIMWSLGNELQNWGNVYDDWGVTPYRLQNTLIKRYDKTRPTTVAMAPTSRSYDKPDLPAELALETEIASYNYRFMFFKGDAARYPNMIFYQSEAAVNAMGPNYYEMELDKVVGLAYWGLVDYLGESGGWPAKGWMQGVFDISLQPKPQAYLMKSMFSDEPIVHIALIEAAAGTKNWNQVNVATTPMTENWNRVDGSQISLYTYTNADEVELLINGKSIGKKLNDKENTKGRNRIRWENISYQKGTIVAIARTNGKEVARHILQTTGKAVALKLEPDTISWKADGMDLQHIRVYAVDSKGRRVFDANQNLTFEVEGNARIVAVDNGDLTSEELHVGNQRRLFQGSALVILRAGQHPGQVVLKASTSGLKTARINLQTK